MSSEESSLVKRNDERRNKLKAVFTAYANDGNLKQDQIKEAFQQLGSLMPDEDSEEAMKVAGAYPNGSVSNNEIDNLVDYAYNKGFGDDLCEKLFFMKKSDKGRGKLKDVFLAYARNSGGKLEKRQIKEAFQQLGSLMPYKDAEEAMKVAGAHNRSVDTNNDKEIDNMVDYAYNKGFGDAL